MGIFLGRKPGKGRESESENGKNLEFETLDERVEGGRRLFTIGAMVNGQLIAEAKAYNKKDASQVAAALALEKLGLNKVVEPGEESTS